MCRLMLANKTGVLEFHKWLLENPQQAVPSYRNVLTSAWKLNETLPKAAGLQGWLEQMEDCLGGHGNGLALLRGTELVAMVKGVQVSVATTAQMLLTYDYDWAVWHTRYTSSGATNDANCHPFCHNAKKHEMVWCMNGTETPYTTIGRFMNHATDTEVIGKIALELGLSLPEFFDAFTSVFVGTVDGKPFVAKNSGSLVQFKNKNEKAILFCSQLPREVETVLPIGYLWFNGQVLSSSKKQWWEDEDDVWDDDSLTLRHSSFNAHERSYSAPYKSKGKLTKLVQKTHNFNIPTDYMDVHRKEAEMLLPLTAAGMPWYTLRFGSSSATLVGKVLNHVEFAAVVTSMEKAENYARLPESLKGICVLLSCEMSARRTQTVDSYGRTFPKVESVIHALCGGTSDIAATAQKVLSLVDTMMQDKALAPFICGYEESVKALLHQFTTRKLLRYQVGTLLAYVLLSMQDIRDFAGGMLQDEVAATAKETEQNKSPEQ